MNKIGWRLVKMLRGVIEPPLRTREVNATPVKVQDGEGSRQGNSSINGTAKAICSSSIS